MPFRTLKLKPGVDLESSQTVNDFQLATSNLIRFYGGFVQQIGGWTQKTVQRFVGVCRGLHGWADIVGNAYLAIGTDQRLEVLINGTIEDITPVVQTNNPAVAFSTTLGSSVVTIHDAAYTPNAGDWINLQTPVSVGGVVLFSYYLVTGIVDSSDYTVDSGTIATATVVNGGAVPSYTTTNASATVNVLLPAHGIPPAGGVFNAEVSTTVATVVISGIYSATVVDQDNFTIVAGSTANANTTASENGGNARIAYLLPSGTAVATAVSGFGIGNYGAGDYGGSSDNSGAQIIAPGREWSLDHWGQDLIASPSRGLIYYWQPAAATPALVVSGDAPLQNISVFVMPQVQIIVSLGAEAGGTLQPLLIRWCDAGDFTDWTVAVNNQAGSYLVPTGSRIVGGLATGLGATFWTDTDVWSMTYIGYPLVFGFNRVAVNCGLVAQRAVGVAAAFVMWLGVYQFFQYAIGGGVQPIECSVWDFYFFNVDQLQLEQIFCAVNSVFNEMTWFFPISASSPVYDPAAPIGYLKFNYVEKVWDYGQSALYQRTAWVNQSPAGLPIGADTAGLLQEHEVSRDANGQAMLWSWQTGYFDLDDGEAFIFSDFLIPDWVVVGQPSFIPNVLMTDYPNADPTQVVVPSFTSQTDFVTYSARGRQMSFGFSGAPSNIGTFSRLGAVRVRTATDGRN